MPHKEKRRFGRRQVDGIKGTLRAPGDVQVLDISLMGLSIEVAEELDVGQRLFLELQHRSHAVNLEVEVKWVSLRQAAESQLPLSRAGVSFVDIFRDAGGGIWDWILVDDGSGSPPPAT